MVEYRAFLCNDCLINGKCLICGCSTPGLFYAPLKKDSRKKWPSIVDEDHWNSFKENDPNYKEYIKLKLNVNTETTAEKSDET